jgi:hypothetical protein
VKYPFAKCVEKSFPPWMTLESIWNWNERSKYSETKAMMMAKSVLSIVLP